MSRPTLIGKTLRKGAPLATLVALTALTLQILALPVLAHAQDRDSDWNDDGYEGPPVGAEVSRDYLTGEYYDYKGTPRRDKRVGEQSGWRDGVLHTPPAWYWRRCGCSSLYYGGRHYQRPAMYSYDTVGRAQTDYRSSYNYRWPRSQW